MSYCIEYVDTDLSNREKNEMLYKLIKLLDQNRGYLQIHPEDNFQLQVPSHSMSNREGLIKQVGLSDEDKKILMDAIRRKYLNICVRKPST